MIKIISFSDGRQAPGFPSEIALVDGKLVGLDVGELAGREDRQKEGKPRAVPGAFRSNPPIKSVKTT
jgi:hypothetical protein